jgi:short-subunit dehydrogenase
MIRERSHVLITGASSGMGAGLACSYAEPGVTLSLIGRSNDRLQKVADICTAKGAEVRCGSFDVGEHGPLGQWIEAGDALRPIDLVIANAGTSGGPHEVTHSDGLDLAGRLIKTNLLGIINTIEPLLPRLIERSGAQIAVVASVAGYRGLPDSPTYSASKAGVRAYGEALRARLKPSGLSVSVIVPGFFDSPMTDRFQGGKPMLYSLERAVSIVRKGLDRRASRIVFPYLLAVGLQAVDLLPAFLGDAIIRQFPFNIQLNESDFLDRPTVPLVQNAR